MYHLRACSRKFMEDLIERALVGSESNDQLEFECICHKDLVIAREGSDSIMHVRHWTLTFEPLALSAVKPVLSKE